LRFVQRKLLDLGEEHRFLRLRQEVRLINEAVR
jgi:hypothetical protein